MALFALLPPEILAHILKLSTEGQHADDRQRGRFTFGLVARACFLATADATEFHVAGEAQAKALVAKLEREKKWAAQEERKGKSGRTTRATLSITRVSNVRRLSLIVDNKKSGKAFTSLFHATPKLVALDLDLFPVSQWGDQRSPIMAQLQPAIGGLALLQELKCHVHYFHKEELLSILLPLKELRVLDFESGQEVLNKRKEPHTLLNRVALPHLREFRIRLRHSTSFNKAILCALASKSTAGIKVLDLTSTSYDYISPTVIAPLIPHITNVIHLAWTPETEFLDNDVLDTPTRDALLELLGAMTSLQSIEISTWAHSEQRDDDDDGNNDLPIDTSLFDTLATLPSLHTVNILVKVGTLEADQVEQVISYITSHRPLRSLSINLERPGAWTREQCARVEEASEKAGVAFAYNGSFV
ncbi:hypothetical protein RQP46_000077 [Phenoliferia psychrophenolica]